MIEFESTRFHIVLFFIVSSSLLLHTTDAQAAAQRVAPRAVNDGGNSSFAVFVVVLVFAFFVVGFFSFFLRHCSETYVVAGNSIGGAASGIDPKLLATFPIMEYSTVKDLKLGNWALECAVCLSEFKDYDTIRLLPKCSHVFHPDCIDAWLASHVTCPVCRAKLNPNRGEVAIAIGDERHAHQVFDESSVRRGEVVAAGQQHPVVTNVNEGHQENGNVDWSIGKQNCSSKLRTFGMLVRSHSTGHSLFEPGKNLERYTLRLPEEVRRQILVTHVSMMRRSASYDVFEQIEESSKKGCVRSEGEGSSSKGNKDGGEKQNCWLLSMTPPFVYRGWVSSGAALNASGTCSGIPSFWGSSSLPSLHPL